MTPKEFWEKLIQQFVGNDFLWLLIDLILLYGIFYVSMWKLNRTKYDVKNVIFSFISTLAWVFAFLVIGRKNIDSGGFYSYCVLVISTVLSFLSTLIALKKKNIWSQVIPGIITAVLLFSMPTSVVINNLSFFHSLIFGFILGILLTKMFTSIIYLNSDTKVESDDDIDMTIPKGF